MFNDIPWTIRNILYIVIHRRICFVLSELISVARRVRFPKLGSKPGWLKCQSKILPLSHEETSASDVNLNGYESKLLLFTYIRLTATESSIHMNSLAYTLMATQLLPSRYISSSSCRAGSTDIPDPLSPLLPIVHRPRQVFRTTSCILT